ncbi:hypothetical protein cgp_2505 [Corynebacterium glutamicum MB001]|nr:hypothetical protein cgp_2505 [Corynebacterium glutamicum MB001]ASW14651.1 hypothetical protein cgc1_2505 [Corynebacterium glutamicum]QYO74253.1 hypothetical protein cgisf_2505 [Corynebacterium glutamicum]
MCWLVGMLMQGMGVSGIRHTGATDNRHNNMTTTQQ